MVVPIGGAAGEAVLSALALSKRRIWVGTDAPAGAEIIGESSPSLQVARALRGLDAPHAVWFSLGPSASWREVEAWASLLGRSRPSRGDERWVFFGDEATPWALMDMAAGLAARLRLDGLDASTVRWRGAFDPQRWSLRGADTQVAGPAPHAAPDGVAFDLRARSAEEQRAAVTAWIRAQIARELDLPESEIPLDTPLASLGLDSIIALELVVALEEWCGIEAEADQVMALPGITAVTDALLAMLDRPGTQVSR